MSYQSWDSLYNDYGPSEDGITDIPKRMTQKLGAYWEPYIGGGTWKPGSPVQNISNPGGVLAPAILGAGAYIAGQNHLLGKGYDAIQNSYGGWLDDKYDAVADWYKPVTTPFNFSPHPAEAGDPYYAQEDWKPNMIAEGPLSRNSRANAPRRQYDGRTNEYWMPIPGSNVRKVWSAEPMEEPHPYDFDPKGEVIPSNEIPGYDRMINEGYDSWSPSDAIHNTWTDSNTHGYKPYSEWTQDEKDLGQKEHMQRIDTARYNQQEGFGTLYPGKAADRYYDSYTFPSQEAYVDAIQEHYDGTREYQMGPNNRTVDNRSDWQKWKDSVSGGRR